MIFETAQLSEPITKAGYEKQVTELRLELLNAQYELRRAGFPVIVLLTGDDGPGVDETLDVLHEWMDARAMLTRYFGRPTEEERRRPRFWRYWHNLPAAGQIGIYLGAWATTLLGDRIRRRIGKSRFERCLAFTERFERAQVDNGAVLLKFWLHLPRKELRKRLKRARKDPDREPLVASVDWDLYARWNDVDKLVVPYLRRTSTTSCPWQIIESTDARFRNLTIARKIQAAIRERLDGKPPVKSRVPRRSLDPVDALSCVDLTQTIERGDYKRELARLQGRLARLTRRARKAGRTSTLVFEGWDAAGKGGAIRRITGPISARDYRLIQIAAPSDEEKAHHYLWRFWRSLPPAGQIAIFDRSWYGRVLVERVEGFASQDQWRRAYPEIVDFEEQLADRGNPVLKFWLHIDPAEQLRRFAARENTPYKQHKITEEDYRNREKWDDYVAAVNEMVARTSTEIAPWILVAANDKRRARLAVLQAVCDGMKRILR